MDFSRFNLNYLTKLVTTGIPLLSSWNYGEQYHKCLALKSNLSLENTTILDVSYLTAGSRVKVTPYEKCESKAYAGAPLCRVQFSTTTSSTSAIRAEAWLPDEWYGRFLALGNGGFGGCIAYSDLRYGSTMHFATVASNNGHDGNSGVSFVDPEVLNDHTFRSIHVETVVGKQIAEAYYGQPHSKSYYLGCSAGGRQGTQAALNHPEDFDGILAGAPGTDANNLLHWMGMVASYVGAGTSDPFASPSFIPSPLWKLVAKEILRQCDALDGVVDGLIAEPDACAFRPEALLCRSGESGKCLTAPQVEALRKIYAPLYAGGELIYPRYDPGAEGLNPILFSGDFPFYAGDWIKYAILNDSSFDLSTYGPEHGHLANQLDPGGVSTWSGDLSAFRDRGGKFLTYHGRVDPIVPSGNSKRFYDLIARTLHTPILDDFYRLFLVPGAGHCEGGLPGSAPHFGQRGGVSEGVAVNASSHNVLLALVEWVEGGVAPDTIVGTAEKERGKGKEPRTRAHCRYPMKSVWHRDREEWVCEL